MKAQIINGVLVLEGESHTETYAMTEWSNNRELSLKVEVNTTTTSYLGSDSPCVDFVSFDTQKMGD